jgi:hypothetical protein
MIENFWRLLQALSCVSINKEEDIKVVHAFKAVKLLCACPVHFIRIQYIHVYVCGLATVAGACVLFRSSPSTRNNVHHINKAYVSRSTA